MKERGILFSAPMVRALLAGTKGQTRRAVKPQPHILAGDLLCWKDSATTRDELLARCPYGKPGDRLWVRETFFAYGRWETRFSEKKARDEWHFVDMTQECDRAYQYAADAPEVPLAVGRGPLPGWYRRPAIFMPAAACRITREVTAVRIERLQEISERDAVAEGIHRYPHHWHDPEFPLPDVAYESAEGSKTRYSQPSHAYRELWESINGAGSWDANPWLWVVTLKHSEATQ